MGSVCARIGALHPTSLGAFVSFLLSDSAGRKEEWITTRHCDEETAKHPAFVSHWSSLPSPGQENVTKGGDSTGTSVARSKCGGISEVTLGGGLTKIPSFRDRQVGRPLLASARSSGPITRVRIPIKGRWRHVGFCRQGSVVTSSYTMDRSGARTGGS